MIRSLSGKWRELQQVQLELQTDCPVLQFRTVDAQGRFYQRNIKLNGDGPVVQKLTIDRFFGSKSDGFAQWGKGVQNQFQSPMRSYYLSFPAQGAKQREVVVLSLCETGVLTIKPNGQAMPDRYRIEPGGELRLPLSALPDIQAMSMSLSDYNGKPVPMPAEPVWDAPNKQLHIRMPKERGFYELSIPSLDMKCGLMIAPVYDKPMDAYFSMDTALSVFGFYNQQETRRSALALLKACGIGTIRDRLVWNAIEPQRGNFQFTPDSRLEQSWPDMNDAGTRELAVFHDSPTWAHLPQDNEKETRYPYPRDIVAVADGWRTIANHWGKNWDALEVWNEPEIAFGDSLPGDRVAAVQHAVSDCKYPSPCGWQAGSLSQCRPVQTDSRLA